VVTAINRLLQKDDLLAKHAWARDLLEPNVRRDLEEDGPPQNSNQVCYRNRRVLEALLSGSLASIERFPFRRPGDFKGELAQRVCDQLSTTLPEQVAKGQVIFQSGDPADALYLVLQGTFRISLPGQRGEQVYNHIQTDGFFGEASIMDDGPAGPPRRSARVEALSRGVLLRLERSVMRELCDRFPELKERFTYERARLARRDRSRQAGWSVPPKDPPLDIATRLQVTTNLLVIDMDRCTRCDQCVQACAAAHEDRPRFHRSNPDLRFGKWEVAGACLHCSDAPCLEECPVGAITFLDTGAVQIHRNRCIGCAKCAGACPFGVIDMYHPVENNPADRASLPKNKEAVATKCDLCLTTVRQPPCVAACPYGAAFRGPPDAFFPGIRDWEALTSVE
jgi:Fe-S-cluster-containing hydrogenase component 2